jgi:ribosomal protein S18 acetylase RimI-like enzyme
MNDAIEINELSGRNGAEGLPELVELLLDAVESGASVGFLDPLEDSRAEVYWRDQLDEVSRGKRVVLVAREQGRIVGSVQLALAAQQNGQHRAEVQRLIVHRSFQRRGIGAALMRRVETTARRLGKTLLVLNTRTGDPPEALYRSLGYQPVGTIPAFAQNPDGTFNTTSIMYRQL